MVFKIILVLICVLFGVFSIFLGIHGLKKNYEVTHGNTYKVIEGRMGYRYCFGHGSTPYVTFIYNNEELVRSVDSTKHKQGEIVKIYYNPEKKEEVRMVDDIDNRQYYLLMIPSLVLFGAAFVICFPELFI